MRMRRAGLAACVLVSIAPGLARAQAITSEPLAPPSLPRGGSAPSAALPTPGPLPSTSAATSAFTRPSMPAAPTIAMPSVPKPQPVSLPSPPTSEFSSPQPSNLRVPSHSLLGRSLPGQSQPVAAIVPHVDAAPRPPRPVQVQPFQDRLALRQTPPVSNRPELSHAEPSRAALSHAAPGHAVAPHATAAKAALAKAAPGPKSPGKVTRTAASAKVKAKTALRKPPTKAVPHLG